MRKPNYFFLALTWTIVVSFLSLAKIEGIEATIKFSNIDKMVHFVFYFLFYILWFLYFISKKNHPKLYWIILLGSIGFGIMIEVVQGLIGNNRTPDSLDVFANSVGAFCGLLVSIYFLSNKKQI